MLSITKINTFIDVFYQLTNILFPTIAILLALVSILCLKLFNSIRQNTIIFFYIRLYYVVNSISLLFSAFYAPFTGLLASQMFLSHFLMFIHHGLRSLRRILFVIIALNRYFMLCDKQIPNWKNYICTLAFCFINMVAFCIPDLFLPYDSKINFILEIIESTIFLVSTIALTLILVLIIRKRSVSSGITKVVFYNQIDNKQNVRLNYQEESILSSRQAILQVNSQNQHDKVSRLVVILSIVFIIDQSINIIKILFIFLDSSANHQFFIYVFSFLYEIIFNLSDLFIYCKFNDRFAQSFKMNYF